MFKSAFIIGGEVPWVPEAPLPSIQLEEVLGARGRFQTSNPYKVNITNVNKEIIIPKGYVTDMASVPRFLWPILGPHEIGITAPVVHDYLRDKGELLGVSRRQADSVFKDILRRQMVDRGSAWRAGAAVDLWTNIDAVGDKIFKTYQETPNWAKATAALATLGLIGAAAYTGFKRRSNQLSQYEAEEKRRDRDTQMDKQANVKRKAAEIVIKGLKTLTRTPSATRYDANK